MHLIHYLQIRFSEGIDCYIDIIRLLSDFAFHDMDRLAIYDQCSDRIGYDQCQRNHKDHTALDLFSHTLFHIITYSYGIRLPGLSQSVHLHLRASVLRF